MVYDSGTKIGVNDGDITLDIQIKFLLMTLGDIIKEKVLYKGSLKNYEHNLKVLN